ncbi:MAG TPA: tetratricopeptide repeat protein [Candidatus Obscuribacterales bacterium]
MVAASSAFSAAWAADPLQDGLRLYASGRYRDAVVVMSRAALAYPASPVVHYHLANALVKAGMHEQAMQEYQLSYRLDPYSSVAGYCRMALKAYGVPEPEASQGHARLPVPAGWRNGPAGDAFVIRAKTTIRRQAEFEKSKHRSTGEALAALAFRHAETDLQKIRQEMNEQLQRALEPPVMTLPTGRGVISIQMPFNPEIAKARADAIRREAQEQERQVRQFADMRASQYRRWSKEREYALEEVVANLESQLDEPVGRSGVKLQPIGTDLYVRYYGYQRYSKEMPDTQPASVRIVGDRASQGVLDRPSEQPPLRIERRVRGKVLR